MIRSLAVKEFKNKASAMTVEDQRKELRELVDNIYAKTINYRDARLSLEEKIKHPYFDGSAEAEEERRIWRELIQL